MEVYLLVWTAKTELSENADVTTNYAVAGIVRYCNIEVEHVHKTTKRSQKAWESLSVFIPQCGRIILSVLETKKKNIGFTKCISVDGALA